MGTSKTPKDHVIAVIKAGPNVVPLVGGSIASLIGDYVPASTQRSIEKTMKLLEEKLTSLQGRIDVEAVNNEEFSGNYHLDIVGSNGRFEATGRRRSARSIRSGAFG